MIESNDKLLAGKGLSSKGNGYEFLSLPKEFFVIVDSYLTLVWNIKNGIIYRDSRKKSISVGLILDNTKILFSEENRLSDRLWMQHCAYNLRELLDDIRIPDDFNKFRTSSLTINQTRIS